MVLSALVHLGSALVFWVLNNEAEKIGLVSCSFFSIKAKENFMTFCVKKLEFKVSHWTLGALRVMSYTGCFGDI